MQNFEGADRVLSKAFIFIRLTPGCTAQTLSSFCVLTNGSSAYSLFIVTENKQPEVRNAHRKTRETCRVFRR